MQKFVNLVHLVKGFPTTIHLQRFVSIQPRTSLEKSDVSWPTGEAMPRYADWQDWGPCDASCGQGMQTAARSVAANSAFAIKDDKRMNSFVNFLTNLSFSEDVFWE